jgi:hypothetical protein
MNCQLLEKLPVRAQRQMYYQHDGARLRFSRAFRQSLNQQFPNRWIGYSGAQNWPPRSRDLNRVDYHVWGYVKALVYARKLNARELLQRILSAARGINNAAVLLTSKFVSSHVTRVSKCIQANGAHFE